MMSAPDSEGRRDIEYCGIDVDLYDIERGLTLLREELIRLEAPAGTQLEYELNGADVYEPIYLSKSS